MVQHLLVMNCLPLAGNTPHSYLRAPGWTRTYEGRTIEDDAIAMHASRNLGKRVGEMAMIVKMGIHIFKNGLAPEYHVYGYFQSSEKNGGCTKDN